MNVNPDFSDKAKRDFELVSRAQNGDEQAFTALLSSYKDSIYFMVLKMVKNKPDAEDLTIEAFGKAFRNIEQYSPEFAFSTWLFKIASNNCIDFLRRKKTRQLETVSTSAAEGETTIGEVFAKEATMERNEIFACWKHAILITPHQRNEVKRSVGLRRHPRRQRAEGTQQKRATNL